MSKPPPKRISYVNPVNNPNNKKAIIEGALEELYSQNGTVNQKMLVDYARPDDSPLHPYFEWDDATAAEKHRETQALQMIMASKFVVLINKSSNQVPKVIEGTPVRKLLPAFSGGGFTMRNEVLNEKDAREQLIERKKTQLRAWCREAIDIEELEPLRSAILKLL